MSAPYLTSTLDGNFREVPSSFTFQQMVPAAIWTINHPLEKKPSVTVIDSAGSKVEGDVTYPSDAQVVLTFGAGFSGSAILN